MPNAISNNERLAYIKETSWGVVPASAMQLLRYVSIDDGQERGITESDENNTSSQTQDLIQTSTRGGLNFAYELSYGLLDDLLESVFGAAWTGPNTLNVGVLQKSLAFERQWNDITQFMSYKGALVNSLSIDCQIGKAINGKATIQSKFPVPNIVTIGTGAATAALTNSVMDPIASIVLAQEGGAGSIAGLTAFSLNFQRDTIDEPQLNSVDPADLQPGQFTAMGNFSLYFPNRTYLDKFLNWTGTSLAFTLGGAANLKYAFAYPNVKFTTGKVPNTGKNTPIVQKFDWKAYKAASASLCTVTRTP